MKRIALICLSVLLICSCGQTRTANGEMSGTYVAEGTIPVRSESDIEWITRYEDQIKGLDEKAVADTLSEVDVVFFLSWKYSELRAGLREKQKMVNRLIEEYASISPQVTFVDVNSLLLNEDGSVNSSLFESDNLHINREGYLLWTSLLKPQLIEICKP